MDLSDWDDPSPHSGLGGLLPASPEAYAEMRKRLLRGTLMEWWSVVKDDIEQRTAATTFIDNRQKIQLGIIR